MEEYKIRIPVFDTEIKGDSFGWGYHRSKIHDLVQNKAFKLGYFWKNNCTNETNVQYTDKEFLFLSSNRNIVSTDSLYVFNQCNNLKEISWQDFLKLPEPENLEILTTGRVRNNSGILKTIPTLHSDNVNNIDSISIDEVRIMEYQDRIKLFKKARNKAANEMIEPYLSNKKIQEIEDMIKDDVQNMIKSRVFSKQICNHVFIKEPARYIRYSFIFETKGEYMTKISIGKAVRDDKGQLINVTEIKEYRGILKSDAIVQYRQDVKVESASELVFTKEEECWERFN